MKNMKNTKRLYVSRKSFNWWSLYGYPIIAVISIVIALCDLVVAFIPIINAARLDVKDMDKDYLNLESLYDEKRIYVEEENIRVRR